MKQVYDTLYDCLEVLNTSNSEKKIEILDLINNSIVKLEDIIHSNTKSLELPTFCKQTKKIIKFIEQRLLSLENEAEFNCLGNLSKENLQSERAIVKEKIDDCISRIIEVENEISLSFRAEFQESDSTGSSNSDEYDASDLSAINEFTKRYLQEKELDDILSLKTEEQVEFNTRLIIF